MRCGDGDLSGPGRRDPRVTEAARAFSPYLGSNLLRWRDGVRRERIVRTAFPDGRAQVVHERDLAEVAVRALLDDTHRGRAYSVIGGAETTEREQVAALAAALGEPIELVVLTEAEYERTLRPFVAAEYVDMIMKLKGNAPKAPDPVQVDSVRVVVGRDPLPLAAWASDHVDEFR